MSIAGADGAAAADGLRRLRAARDAVSAAVVGRSREIELVLAAVDSGRHVLLEGPPGTGKSTLLRSAASALSTGLAFVEGNAELTPARLSGHFDPARVLSEGYVEHAFMPGPLVEAMREGWFLYVEELNRVPEETVNLLIGVMSESELHLPRVGRIAAHPGFRVVAAMNPYDNVGTARVASAIYDRICRVAMTYQTAAEEREITRRSTASSGSAATAQADGLGAMLIRRAVAVTRATRSHAEVRMGSSVRGAIDLVEVATRLATLRGLESGDARVGLDAALVALTGRIRLHEGCGRAPEDIITELWDAVLARESEAPSSGSLSGDDVSGAGSGPAGPGRPRETGAGGFRRTVLGKGPALGGARPQY